MLPFFRKTRWRLAQNNQFFKYSRYAVGEIVLVVVGILIALQVNDWNQKRKTHSLEIKILREFVAGLTTDAETLEYNSYLHNRAIESCEIVLNSLNHGEFKDSLSFHFGAVNYYTNFSSARGAYESTKSIGFAIISNTSLRNGIIDLYDKWYPILISNSNSLTDDISSLKRGIYQSHFNKFQVFNPNPPPIYQGEMTPIDFNSLRLNNEYKYHINSLKSSHSSFVIFNRHVLEILNQVKTQCEEEIKKLE